MNSDDIERRKRAILASLGEGGRKALEEGGIDLGPGITALLKEQGEEMAMRDLKTAIPTTDNTMTSELVYLSDDIGDNFGQEYVRRLSLIGLSESDIDILYHQETEIIGVSKDLSYHRKQPWVMRYFVGPNSSPDKMPKAEELTLSELIMITDDASSAFVRDRHRISGAAWDAVCMAAPRAGNPQYLIAFNARTEGLGWSKAQRGAFTKNECILIARLKWSYDDNPAWTVETTDLKQYEL